MARRSQHSFIKRQKEIERKQRALEKMTRRQEKKKPGPEAEGEPEQGAPEESES
jgi:hypothetical protein